MAWLVEALQTKRHSWDDPKCEFYLARKHRTHTHRTHTFEFSRYAQKVCPKVFSYNLREIIPQLHHQVVSVFSLFVSFYLCSHMLPGRKSQIINKSFQIPQPPTDRPLLCIVEGHILEDLRTGLSQRPGVRRYMVGNQSEWCLVCRWQRFPYRIVLNMDVVS